MKHTEVRGMPSADVDNTTLITQLLGFI